MNKKFKTGDVVWVCDIKNMEYPRAGSYASQVAPGLHNIFFQEQHVLPYMFQSKEEAIEAMIKKLQEIE